MVGKKLTLFKSSGAAKVELVFGKDANLDSNWLNAVQEEATNLGITLELKKIRVHPDGRKEWLPPL